MTAPACPCGVFSHPRIIANPPGRASIGYRVGDYTAFRHALLLSRPDETALAEWHATAGGDLALQLLEWWAYLADVLTFYNERGMHEALLRTAGRAEDVRRIVRLLGYRPRPGIGATGIVAALTDSARPFVLARGFPIQSASESGNPPQVFELDQDVEIGLLGLPLPESARFPRLTGRAGTSAVVESRPWGGYAARGAEGRLLSFVPADEAPPPSPPIAPGQRCTVTIDGVVTLLKTDDTVLILKRDWNGEPEKLESAAPAPLDHALAVVDRIAPSWDAFGRPVTHVTLHPGHELPAGSLPQEYRILKATKLAHLWLYHERYPGMKTPTVGGLVAQAVESFFDPAGLFTGGISKEPPQDPHVLTSEVMSGPPGAPGVAHLEAITRGISPGDPVLFEQKVLPGGLASLFAALAQAFGSQANQALADLQKRLFQNTLLAKVTDYSEVIWYANPPEGDRIGQGPPVGPPSHALLSGGAAPIPIPHSQIRFNDPHGVASLMSGVDDVNIGTVVVHYGWQEVGDVAAVADGAPPAQPTAPVITQPAVPPAPGVPPEAPVPVVIEDATGAGVPGWLGVTNPEGPPLVGPLRALLNLLPVSRGQTVAAEILGSGDAILINQEFALKRSPLTYLADTGPGPMNGYRSTLRIRVGGIEWHEVATFFGQRADARVFVTREDDEQRTHVRFGDGEFGARLPSGTDNVVATYRFGSGAEVPRIGSLTTILRPQEGLQAIRNPIPPGGGADPDPPEQIRRYAPASVLTFGRAVSGDDYETVAAQTPGVSRARARWTWDAPSQRTLVKVFVGDDDAAVAAARRALRAFADPNRPIVVELAAPLFADLSFTLEVDPDFAPDAVSAAVRGMLLDPQQAPFGRDVVRIGDAVYDSQISDVCLRVPGVVAVHGIAFEPVSVAASIRRLPPGFGPAFKRWDAVLPGGRTPRESGERHSPGEGRFYLLGADRLHITTELVRHGR